MLCIHTQTISKTLSPQWREQFDLHLYEETAGVLEMSVWDKDTGRRDDFIGRSVPSLCVEPSGPAALARTGCEEALHTAR